MSHIHLLDSEVVDQIAAGEVLERPAHLVKELLENAIDAEATSVEIDFYDGGRRVRIKDNGHGIRPGQLPMALSRHATSKISQSDDLWALKSYGFRGEALASVASVSELTLLSRFRGEEMAEKLVSRFGQQEEVEVTGAELGTTVLVDKLFENTQLV